LRSEVASVLQDPHLLTPAGLHSVAVEKLWGNFLQKPRVVGWSRPWSLYVLAKWCEINRVAAA
jgi:asparagine synthase (glutamine-hydrolysing)